MVKTQVRKPTRTSVALAFAGLLATLLAVTPSGVAQAAASVPPLNFPAVNAAPNYSRIVTSPSGNVTVGCSEQGTGQDLITYSPTGAVVSQISRTTQIDGVDNCIGEVVTDKNGGIYGVPYGKNSVGTPTFGPNLLAYSGNTLKWKYPVHCGSDQQSRYAVGANGNIYATTYTSNDGVHLIGLAPDLAAGQTQPTKVLDIKVANDCNIMLRPYKDGIMLHGQSSGGALYYSYGGKYLGSTAGNVWYEKINAEGRLFTGKYTSGAYKSASISVYHPATGQTAWETVASTPGANTDGIWPYPLPGGGVAALVHEQRMLANGVPASPTEWVYTLTTINVSGVRVRSQVLPNVDAQGNMYEDFPIVVTDTTGKITIVRQVQEKTTAGYPTTVTAIEVNVIDSITGVVTYSSAMRGNTIAAAGAVYGYRLNYVGDNGPTTGPNTLFIMANCSGTCPDHNTRLYPISIAGMGMDYPRGAVLGAYPRPSASYVALGDSFSSGESLTPFEADTDVPGVNTCHRSGLAYPRLISGTSAKIPSLGANSFRACSGAVTNNIWDAAQWNEGIQTDRYPDSTTQLVTLTIGGNDIGFSVFATACATPSSSCDVGTTAYNNALNHITGDLAGKLTSAYQNILSMAPNAKVYVIGYPQVVANKLVTDSLDSRCPTMAGGTTNYGNARAARYIVGQLDQKISDTVTAVGNARLRYVAADLSTSPFAGHEVCGTDSTSWFQNMDQFINNPAYVFHPNALGQQGYATIAMTAINAG